MVLLIFKKLIYSNLEVISFHILQDYCIDKTQYKEGGLGSDASITAVLSTFNIIFKNETV